ncbi:MAG: ester cyclase [Actinobacteria bacterium]|nr:ester cyclase [Actinomycetota bacterium]
MLSENDDLDFGRALVHKFFEYVQAGDPDAILGLTSAEATITLVPLGIRGLMANEGVAYFASLASAFPDLIVRIRRVFTATDGTAVAEVTIDGTQAGEFLGVVNQEKHFDLDQAWLLKIGPDQQIVAVTGYWDQNQLYRRLGVKRLDRITITALEQSATV